MSNIAFPDGNRTNRACSGTSLGRAAGAVAVAITLIGTVFNVSYFFSSRSECKPPDELQPGCEYSVRLSAFFLSEYKAEINTLSPCQSDPKEQCLSAVDESLLEKCNEAADIANSCQEGLRPKLKNVFNSLMALSSVLFVVFQVRISENPSPLPRLNTSAP